MVRVLFLVLMFFSLNGADVYEKNCVNCHKSIPVSIDKYFYRYLLKYSSEKNLKDAMLEYMQKPSKESSVMPEAFISRFGVKEKSSLDAVELKSAIDIYWDKYKVFGKLK